MTDEQPQPPHEPNWGNAYPPPGQQPPGYPPPGVYYPPPGQAYYPPPGYGYAYPQHLYAPKHQSATTALVLGLVGTAGAVACYLPVFVAPFAWFTGARTLREIDASRGTLSGRSEAKAGMILGIVGTVMLVLGLCLFIALFVLPYFDGSWEDDGYIEYDETAVDAALGAFAYLRG